MSEIILNNIFFGFDYVMGEYYLASLVMIFIICFMAGLIYLTAKR